MTPIAKNITVVDERGNTYEVTYLKRARGLVKHGRARFIDENTICLACPPNMILEDEAMNNSLLNDDMPVGTENRDAVKATEVPQVEEAAPTLTMDFVLTRIDRILNDTAHIHEAIAAAREMPVNGGLNNQTGDTARAEAVTKAVQARETTNQQLLRLLEKMYDDLKPKGPSEESLKFQQLTEALCRYPTDVAEDVLTAAVNQMFLKL